MHAARLTGLPSSCSILHRSFSLLEVYSDHGAVVVTTSLVCVDGVPNEMELSCSSSALLENPFTKTELDLFESC